MQFRAKNLNWIWIVALGVIIFAAGRYLILTAKQVPEGFSEARIKGARIAEEIIAQQIFTLENLKKIAQHDKGGNTPEALTTISKELIKNREAGQKAIHLSSQLEKMARSITSIRPARARELATAAVTSEVALVSRLLTYNDYLAQLFEVLQSKFQSGGYHVNGDVEDLIGKINDEVQAINDLDKRFNKSLEEFDSLFL